MHLGALLHQPEQRHGRHPARQRADDHDAAAGRDRRPPRRSRTDRRRGRSTTSGAPPCSAISAANASGSSSRGARMPWSIPSARASSSFDSRPCGAGDRAPERLGELDDRGADARPDRVDEHVLAGLQSTAGAHRVVGGHEHLGHAARGDEVEPGRAPVAQCRAGTTTYSACAPPPTTPNTWVPGAGRVTPGPMRSTTPANSMPGMSAGTPGGAG